MLVLMRKKDESIIIDHHIRVMVVEIRHGSVRLGIDAPQGMAIHREEIEKRIQAGEPEKVRR